MSSNSFYRVDVQKYALRSLTKVQRELGFKNRRGAVVFLMKSCGISLDDRKLKEEYIYKTKTDVDDLLEKKKTLPFEMFEEGRRGLKLSGYVKDKLIEMREKYELKNMTQVILYLFIRVGYSIEVKNKEYGFKTEEIEKKVGIK